MNEVSAYSIPGITHKVQSLTDIVCSMLGVEYKSLLETTRKREVLENRQVLQYFLYLYDSRAEETISKEFNQNHEMVYYSYCKICERMAIYPMWRKKVMEIERCLNFEVIERVVGKNKRK